MSFIDTIKKSVISEFTGTISVDKIVLSLLTAFIIGLFIIYIYKKTYSGVVFSKNFALCVLMLAMVTSLIIRTINSNLALSLGMVGALSIVRFRTAVKEPVDTGFMFWAITGGIMSGAGLYLVAIIGSICLGVFYFIGYLFSFKTPSHYLFVVKYDMIAENNINKIVNTLPKHKLKSKSISKNMIELTFEIEIKENKVDILDKFKDIEGVLSTSLINYQNDFGA
ncbi:MAG: DUF4956 domain-containing protein [Bacilli bacterium]